jgi:hypothetical protein
MGLEDGINAVRMLFPRLYIDEERCAAGLEALARYRRSWNKQMGEYKATPVHDSSSHAADALRYLALGYRPTLPKIPRDRYWRAQLRQRLPGSAWVA